MFFWNINALVHKLQTFTLSSYEQAQYYIFFMICYSATTLMQLLPRPTQIDSTPLLITWLAGLVILIGGTVYCYSINKKGGNKDFLVRMMSLLLTGMIRFGILSLLVIIPVAMIVSIVVTLYISPTALQENAYLIQNVGNTLGLAWAIFFYWYLGEQFKKIAAYTRTNSH